MAAKVGRQLHFLDLLAQRLLDKGQKALHFLGLFLGFLLFLLGLEAQILGGHVAELLFHVGHQGLGDELVHILGKQQHVVALLIQCLDLRQLGKPLPALAGGKVDLLLTLRHGVHILLEGNQLTLFVAVEQQQILTGVLVSAVVGHGAVFQLAAEGGVELLVLLPVVFQHGFQFGLDLLLNVPGDDGQLTVVLQHFPADVQGQILTVHNAPDEAEVLGQQILAVLHDHHAGGVELQAPLIVLGVEVVGSLGGDIQQSLEADAALGAGVNHPQRLVVIKELFPIESLVLLVGDILLGSLPDGHHGVEGLQFGVLLVLGGLVFLLLALDLHGFLLRLLHGAGLGDQHLDGVADIVGILADQGADFVLLQILGVFVLVGVGLQGHDDVGAGGILGRFLNGVAVGAVGDPLPGLVLPVLFGDHGDGGGDHKGGVEAYAKLTDDVDILIFLHGLLEAQRAGLGDGAQVLLHFFLGHTDAVVGNRQHPILGIPGDGDGELIPIDAHLVIGEGGVGQLVDGVGGVGDDFPQENLPVGVDGVDHEIQQTLGLGFELLFFHLNCTSFNVFSTLSV